LSDNESKSNKTQSEESKEKSDMSKSSDNSKCEFSDTRSDSGKKKMKEDSDVAVKLDLVPPKNAPEKVNMTHCFKVSLGKCKVVRDVKVLHTIVANLNHHINENVVCKHVSCTKYTNEDCNVVNDGACCHAEFPKNSKDIVFSDAWSCSDEGSDSESNKKSKKQKRRSRKDKSKKRRNRSRSQSPVRC